MTRAAAPLSVSLASLVVALLAGPSLAEADGVSIAVVAVGKDSPSAGQAVVVGRIAKQGFERNPKYDLLDTERVLESGEASAAERRRATADAALARGRSAFDALELSPALESLAEAVVGYEQALAAMTDIGPLVTALKYQGAAYALSGDSKNARRSFERAFVLDLGASAAGFPEEVTTLFEQARAKVEEGPTGTLTVYAAPPAAEVWVDGRFRGSAPLSLDNLPAGRHYVRVARDGYVAFGQPVEVKRRAEETLQATLRPAARFSEYDDLASRLKGGSPQAAAELAGMLKVAQLLWIVTEVTGEDVTVTATLTDGVGGGALAQGTKTFVTTSPRYRSDLELWFAQTFRKGAGVQAPTFGDSGTSGGDPPKGSGFLPTAPTEAPTSGMTILGWVLTGGAILPLGVGIGFGVASLVPWDAYKNGGKLFDQPALSSQLDPSREEVWNSFLVTSIIADVGYVVAAGMAAVGVTLLVLGANEEEEIEDVLASAPLVLPSLPIIVVAGGEHDHR